MQYQSNEHTYEFWRNNCLVLSSFKMRYYKNKQFFLELIPTKHGHER